MHQRHQARCRRSSLEALSAKPGNHNVVTWGRLAEIPRLAAVVADRGYRGLAAIAGRTKLALDIKEPKGGLGLHAAGAALPRRDRLCPDRSMAPAVALLRGTEVSARAWLEVAAVSYLFARLRAEPP